MTKAKIQDLEEVKRWYAEGKTFRWMSEEYERKYHIQINPASFSTRLRRYGVEPDRVVLAPNLVPWQVLDVHRGKNIAQVLYAEANIRAGRKVSQVRQQNLDSVKAYLDAHNLVIHYDPRTRQGWWFVPRREGIDTDLIRVPPKPTRKR